MSKDVFNKVLPAVILVTASALATTTQAVEPANLQAGPVFFTPTLDMEARYVDNLFRTNGEEKSTWVAEVAPRIQAWMQNGVSTYSLSYKLNDSTYASSHADDYTDHQASLDLHHEFTAKNVLNINGEFYDGHEERGTGLSEGLARIIDTPVEYERATIGGDYTYGNRDSKGRLTLDAKNVDYEFQNFRAATQFRDYDQDTYGGTFYWKIGARTDLLAQVRAIDTEYDNVDKSNRGGSFDSEELNYLVGVSWDATAKTSGSIKIGSYDRTYDSQFREGDDGFQWEVAVTYKPRSYSTVDFGTRRYSQETNGLGDFINTEEYTATWKHDWNSRSSTHLGLSLANNDYSGSIRSDDSTNLEASYKHKVRRWFDLGVGYRFENRDSDIRAFDYNQNIYFIKVDLAL